MKVYVNESLSRYTNSRKYRNAELGFYTTAYLCHLPLPVFHHRLQRNTISKYDIFLMKKHLMIHFNHTPLHVLPTSSAGIHHMYMQLDMSCYPFPSSNTKISIPS